MPHVTPWSAPFVAALIGEYVVEILDDIHDAMPRIGPTLASFFEENQDYLKLTKARVTSYWDCYYRHGICARPVYPGFSIVAEIERLMKSLA